MGEGVVRSDRPVTLNAWNHVTIYRDGWTAWLQLNSGPQVAGQSQGLFMRITFKLELFLAGSPNLTLIQSRTTTSEGFTGCVRKLDINGRSYDFRSDNRGDAIDGIDVGKWARTRLTRHVLQNVPLCSIFRSKPLVRTGVRSGPRRAISWLRRKRNATRSDRGDRAAQIVSR